SLHACGCAQRGGMALIPTLSLEAWKRESRHRGTDVGGLFTSRARRRGALRLPRFARAQDMLRPAQHERERTAPGDNRNSDPAALAEGVADAGEETAVAAGGGGGAQGCAEAFEQLSLLVAELRGGEDVGADEQVAAAGAS